jgi:hypothetical protein
MPSTPPFPPHVVVAVSRLARRIAADATPGPGRRLRSLVVGLPDWRTMTVLEATLGSVKVVPATELRRTGGYDVGIALDWLHGLDDPEAGLDALHAAAPAHLLLAAPREPLAKLGVTFTARLLRHPGNAWSAPGFMRFVSRAGAVRDVAHPLGWCLVWVRRN